MDVKSLGRRVGQGGASTLLGGDCRRAVRLSLRLLILMILALHAGSDVRADACAQAIGLQADSALTSAQGIAGDLGIDLAALQTAYGTTVKYEVDEFVSTKKSGATIFRDPMPNGKYGTIVIRVYAYTLQRAYKRQLDPYMTGCEDNGGMDSAYGKGLMVVTYLHELFHLCIGPSADPADKDKWSCTHLAIDLGVYDALCDYVTECKPAASDDPEKLAELKAICVRLGKIAKKLNSTKGVNKRKACITGCTGNTGFMPGNNICGAAVIPCEDPPSLVSCSACDSLQ